MNTDEDRSTPGAVRPANVTRAGCGIRFAEDELQAGIDFSAAGQLKPDLDPATVPESLPLIKSPE
ncbi:hypothetical protein [Marinobacter caseinilyticus]|uniref:hypothetical protein n=1 Tax=Marinobacter caseinilyticus TaxID=2692195 RepID=UPI00140BB19F|nr:hypothetical protein [Marinobacter caseinilyticus]